MYKIFGQWDSSWKRSCFSINIVSQNENLEINVGDNVRVIYNGNRHETNPIEIDTVFHIYLIDENGEVIDNDIKEFKGK